MTISRLSPRFAAAAIVACALVISQQAARAAAAKQHPNRAMVMGVLQGRE